MHQIRLLYIYLFLTIKDLLEYSFDDLREIRAVGLLLVIEVFFWGGLLMPYLIEYSAFDSSKGLMSGIGFVALLWIINFNMFVTNKDWRVQEKAFYNSTPLQRNMMRLGLVCLALFSVHRKLYFQPSEYLGGHQAYGFLLADF